MNTYLASIETNANILKQRIENLVPAKTIGYLAQVVGLTLEVKGLNVSIGTVCKIEHTNCPLFAEVVGFSNDITYLMPLSRIEGLKLYAPVVALQAQANIKVGDSLLGRVLDGAGIPLDNKPINLNEQWPLYGKSYNPLQRELIRKPLDVGIKSINSLLTIGRGQRVGLFAGSGVGKSILMGMLTRFTQADVVVVALVGERSREVQEFISTNLDINSMKKTVIITSPASYSPLLRIHAAHRATAVAEYFRSKGKHVLLLFDSLSRYAQAEREIGLAIGEPPATKGYPPSVFAKIPGLVERAGNVEVGSGSITAIYTVLAEGDDQQDPIVDSARSILDGHIVLSRDLAQSGHYPAIDISQSISRCMNEIVSEEQKNYASKFKELYSIYEKNKDLINIGAYQKGSNEKIDEAINKWSKINNFLQQSTNEVVNIKNSIMQLHESII